MEPIIFVTFINKEIKPNCSTEDLIKLLNNNKKNSMFFPRPKNFEDLAKKIKTVFKPQDKTKKKQNLSYTGLNPLGKRVEITDDLTFDKYISNILVCYKKSAGRSIIIPDVDVDSFFEKEEDLAEEIDISEKLDNFDINDFLKMRESLSSEIKTSQNKIFNSCTENIKLSFNEKLRESAKELFNSSSKNINKNFNDLTKSMNLSSKKLYLRRESALNAIKKTSKEIQNLDEEIRRHKSNREVNVLKQQEKKSKNVESKKKEEPKPEKMPEPEPEPEPEEKIIFRFSKGVINLEKEIHNNDRNKKVTIDNIQIKNISKKEYNSALMSWLKEDNSNEEINFDQENINKEFPFKSKDKYQSQQDVNDLNLNLIVDNPQDETDYKIFVSIINKENKNVISEKPLEIVVKMKKVVTEEEINDILQNLKKEIEYYNLFMEDNDVISTIKEEKGDENKIRTKVKEIYENKKTNKINEMLNKFDRETNFQEYLNNKDVEEKILELKLDEDSIKKWILSQKPEPEPEHQPEPEPEHQQEPEPEPKPNPDPINPNPPIDDDQEKKIEDIIEQLDMELYVKAIIDEEELKQIILNHNFDYDKIVDFISKTYL